MTEDSKRINYLNVGCGDRYVKNWYNVDFISNGSDVVAHNLRRGIPFPDNYFDLVYHSHVLEHFTREDAEKFISECHRVLKPGGVVRIAVPDLEQIARNYVLFLDKLLRGDRTVEDNYDWTMLEMYDQCVRTYGGGGMKDYLRQNSIPNKEFVKKRIGHFFDIMTERKAWPEENKYKSYVKKFVPLNVIRNIKNIAGKTLNPEYKRIGKFRLAGEIHQWMYDRFSLGRLLKTSGFKDVAQKTPTDSYIKNWPQYNLDTEPNGRTYKPDSLFIEAKKYGTY